MIDMFAGPGGWDLGAAAIGLTGIIGIEWDADACATRALNDLATIRADVSTVPLGPMAGKVTGLIGSPPCTMFSQAGTMSGVGAVTILGPAMTQVLDGDDVRAAVVDRITAELALSVGADLTARAAKRADPPPPVSVIEAEARRRATMAALVLEPARYIADLRPEWIALEQVPAVLPLWHVLASDLRELGYSTWAGCLCAADYGVAQTRTRAILIASRVRTVHPPAATHAETPTADLFAAALPPWVSMADALGWPANLGAVSTGDRSLIAGRLKDYERSTDRPAPTLTKKTRETWRVATGANSTLAGRALAPHPGHTREQRDPGAKSRNDGLRLLTEEALVLQSFPPGHRIAGNITAQFLQIGNAVPPLLAGHVLAAAAGLEPPAVTVTVIGPPT